MKHQDYLDQCIELAQSAVRAGNHPFGALLVKDGEIIATSENSVKSDNDVTAHAELALVRKAQKLIGKEELAKCVLYTSTEPCAMCAGSIYWAGIREVHFGCSCEQLFDVVKDGLPINSRTVLASAIDKVKVFDYSDDLKFKKVHQDFWT